MGSFRVVFDTNVLVSALGFGGTPLESVLRSFEDDGQVIASTETLDELSRVMAYDRLPFTAADRDQYLEIVRREAVVVSPNESVTAITADPSDNMFLECAIEGDARFVVSGDDHLLDLKSFRGIEIITAATLLERVD